MSQAGIVNVGSAVGVVDFLQGNSGGPVGPDAGNVIFVVGAGNISVSGNPGTNTLTITDSNLSTWNNISTNTNLQVNNGYICTGGGTLILQMPVVSSQGDMIEITLDGSTGFFITQGAGQSIRLGSIATTPGVGGSISSTQQGDSIRMVCQVANLKWNVLSSMGNPQVI